MTSSLWNRLVSRVVAICFALALCDIAGRQACGAPQYHPAVARVTVQEKGAVSHGSATLVETRDGKGMVVTNWHVVRDAAGPITVRFPNGFQSPARVLKMDTNWDLAALLVWDPGVKPVPIAQRASQLGEPLVIAGYGAGRFRAAAGRCTQYVAPGANMPYEMVEVSVQARQGDSGGPILNQRGELAGVLFGSGGGTTSGSYAGRVSQFLATAWPSEALTEGTQLARAKAPAAPAKEVPSEQMPIATSQPIARSQPMQPIARSQPIATSQPIARSQPLAKATEVTSDDHPVDGERQLPSSWESAPVAQRPIPFRASPAIARHATEGEVAADSTFEITWESLAGKTIGEQVKSVLAMIGACAVILHLLSGSKQE